MKSLLDFSNVCFAYKNSDSPKLVLKDINFKIYPQEFVSLLGPKGCGKSTLLSLISGIYSPDSGDIIINGSNTVDSKAHIGYMCQNDRLFEWRTVYNNITLNAVNNNKNRQRISHLISEYGMDEHIKKTPSELDIAMQKKAALIRSLVHEPDLLILDEPFARIDYPEHVNIIKEIHDIIKNESKTAILATNNIEDAIYLSDRIIILSDTPSTIVKILVLPTNMSKQELFQEYYDKISTML